MKIITCFKVVPEEKDRVIESNGDIFFERAKMSISSFDLFSIEAGTQLIEAAGGTLAALSVGSTNINDSLLKRDVLSKGPDSLYMIADDELSGIDTYQTAAALKTAIGKLGDFDLVICGEGSSDLYAQQVGNQLGQLLRAATINSVSKITAAEDKVIVERTLENEVETLEVPLPAVISVTSDINIPRYATVKQIITSKNKPSTVWTAKDAGLSLPPDSLVILETKAPKEADRKKDISRGDSDEEIQEFIAKISTELKVAN